MGDPILTKINWPPRGHYLVAVSGGVDSVTLLHLLASFEQSQQLLLRVVHVDEGLRPDSHLDYELVEQLAAHYELPFHGHKTKLSSASEELGRQFRYGFFSDLAKQHNIDGIITAHHWDDRLETSVFNVRRGAGRYGRAPMHAPANVYRPLANVRKQELIDYAERKKLSWREDSMNTDTRFTRNFHRHELLPLARQQFARFDEYYANLLQLDDSLNESIDRQFAQIIARSGRSSTEQIELSREAIKKLELPTLEHLLLYMVRQLEPGAYVGASALQALANLAKTGRPGAQKILSNRLKAKVGYATVAITHLSRSVTAKV